MKEKVALTGHVVRNNGTYNFMANMAGGKEIDRDKLLGIALDEISDKKFNRILIRPDRVEIRLMDDIFKISFFGRILGGSDPTRPIRHQGKKIRAMQSLTILLDEKMDEETSEMLNKEKIRLIFRD